MVGNFFPKRTKQSFGLSVWRGLAYVEPIFRQLTQFKIGNGFSTDFWNDSWCAAAPLSRLFPSVFTMAGLKHVTVAQILSRPVAGLVQSLELTAVPASMVDELARL